MFLSLKDLKDNEIHSFCLSFKHSIDAIKDVKTDFAGKKYCITYLTSLVDSFKRASDSKTVEEGYTQLLKILS